MVQGNATDGDVTELVAAREYVPTPQLRFGIPAGYGLPAGGL
jgi:hypothetical protein